MQTIVSKKEIYLIGKLAEVLDYLKAMEQKYTSVQELINSQLN